LAIALDQDHSVYDCLYIATALTEEAPLVTADAKLATIAERCGVEVTLIG
jgi:predicted nucleic acid-binding protein